MCGLSSISVLILLVLKFFYISTKFYVKNVEANCRVNTFGKELKILCSVMLWSDYKIFFFENDVKVFIKNNSVKISIKTIIIETIRCKKSG